MGRVTKPIAAAELIAWFRDDKPDFAPGAGFLYNNSAYFLAGEIVAKVSGKTLEAYLRETFFDPLGMKDTGVFKNAEPPSNMAELMRRAERRAKATGVALAAEREQWRVTLSSIGDAVVTTDDRQFITFLNPVAEQLSGWKLAEARGRMVVLCGAMVRCGCC